VRVRRVYGHTDNGRIPGRELVEPFIERENFRGAYECEIQRIEKRIFVESVGDISLAISGIRCYSMRL
jgi:hypothetical protein